MQTNQINNIAVKITFVPTGENRLVGLSSASFSQLTSKACSVFKIDNPSTISVQYVDEEGDRVTLSFDEELSCALATCAPGKPLRLFISTTKAEPLDFKREVEDKPAVSTEAAEPTTPEAEPEISAVDLTPIPTIEATVQEVEKTQEDQFGHLLAQLEDMGYANDVREKKRNARLIRRFEGDLEQVVAVIDRRKNLRARPKEEKKMAKSDEVDQESLKHLLKLLEEKGFGGSEAKDRRNARLLKKFNNDVAQVEALLTERRAKFQEAKEARTQRKAAKQDVPEDKMTALLADLEAKGFGGDERKTQRNARLLKKFDGDVAQVEAVLAARRAKLITEIPSEYEVLLAQLDAKGLGGDDFARKRNVRLIKRFNGDLTRVEALIMRRQACKDAWTKYEPLLAQLEDKGLGADETAKKRNLRLLKRFDGDVAQVEAWLAKKQRQPRQCPKKLTREQRASWKAAM